MHIARHFVLLLLIFPLLIFIGCGCEQAPQLTPLKTNDVILAFGDSLTYGIGASKEQSYPARLQTLLSRQVVNAGISGEVSATGLKRLPGLLDQHQPRLLILCHGGNDILRRHDLKQTTKNLQQMIELAKSRGTEVVLVGVPQFGLFLSSAPFYEQLAEHNQLPIENDVLGEILKNHTMKADQIHPNGKGYQLLAQRIYALLQTSGAI